MDFLARLKDVGYAKERGAAALLVLSLFALQYLLLALVGPPGWGAAFLALGLCYLVGFFGVASQWFWARWYASGLGWSGVMVGVVGLATVGWHPILALFGGLHGTVVFMLYGKQAAERFEMQETWRQRYGMDEHGVARLGKAVTRGSASLPSLVLWALAPKDGQALWAIAALAASGGVLGLWALIRLRTWSLAALAAAGVGGLVVAMQGMNAQVWDPRVSTQLAPMLPVATAFAALFALTAVASLIAPVVRHFRAPPR